MWKQKVVVLQVIYVHFSAICGHFLESVVVTWQPQNDNKTPALQNIQAKHC